MELFKQPKINWIGRKWWFIGLSLLLFAIGVGSYFVRGLNYGIDFTGGTIILIKFQDAPDWGKIRGALETEANAAPIIQSYGQAASNTVQVRMQTPLGTGEDYEKDKDRLVASLREKFDPEHAGSELQDFNDAGVLALRTFLLKNDPDSYGNQDKTIQETESHYDGLAAKLMEYRNKNADGLLLSLDSLREAGASDAVVARIKQGFFTGPFAIKGLESIGALVGSDLRERTILAIVFSLAAMLVYIAFRFKKPIYGVAAVIALFHDVAITLGICSLAGKEISLTVVAAFLTLIGYSINATIVIFDRVRENLKLMRKEPLFDILNLSINQTLSRTVVTSALTLMAAGSLLFFGGEVLNGFSFVLTVGIIIGGYSSTALSSAVVDWWYRRTAAVAAKPVNKKK